MSIQIATAPVSWGILEVEGWARQKGYSEVLDEMVQAGYTGTELGPYGFLPTESDKLKHELEKRNLCLLGAFVPLPLAHGDRHVEGLRAALDVGRLLSAAGAQYMVLADEMNPSRMAMAGSAADGDGFSPPQWEKATRLLTSIATAALELGLRSVFHHHCGTFVETPSEVARLLEMTDPTLLGICFDTGHYLYGGGDPGEFVRMHGKRIWHLHLKDVHRAVLDEVRRDKVPYLDAIRRGIFCELGAGCVDFPTVIGELQNAGFDGWAVFEQDVDPSLPGVNPMASAARSRAYLRRVVGL
jgi:inosose dehydratase